MPLRLLRTSTLVRLAAALLALRLLVVWRSQPSGTAWRPSGSEDSSVTPSQNLVKVDPLLAAIKLGNTGRMTDSEAALKALLVKGENAGAHNALGVLYAKQDKSDEAMKEFEAAVQADPKLADGYFNRATFRLKMGDKAGALADYAKAVELKPLSSEMLRLAEQEVARLRRETGAKAP